MEDIERGKLIYNYKPQFMGNRNFEFYNLTNLRKLGNVIISNCSYNRLQQEEKVWSG